MFNAGPHSLNQEGHHAKKSDIGPFRVPKGLVREFKVIPHRELVISEGCTALPLRVGGDPLLPELPIQASVGRVWGEVPLAEGDDAKTHEVLGDTL